MQNYVTYFYRAALFSMVPLLFINGIAVLTGLAMYVNYEGCDPLKLGKIKKPDQLLPYLAVDVFEDLPGIAGLFVAAAFSGTLRYETAADCYQYHSD